MARPRHADPGRAVPHPADRPRVGPPGPVRPVVPPAPGRPATGRVPEGHGRIPQRPGHPAAVGDQPGHDVVRPGAVVQAQPHVGRDLPVSRVPAPDAGRRVAGRPERPGGRPRERAARPGRPARTRGRNTGRAVRDGVDVRRRPGGTGEDRRAGRRRSPPGRAVRVSRRDRHPRRHAAVVDRVRGPGPGRSPDHAVTRRRRVAGRPGADPRSVTGVHESDAGADRPDTPASDRGPRTRDGETDGPDGRVTEATGQRAGRAPAAAPAGARPARPAGPARHAGRIGETLRARLRADRRTERRTADPLAADHETRLPQAGRRVIPFLPRAVILSPSRRRSRSLLTVTLMRALTRYSLYSAFLTTLVFATGPIA